MTDIKRASKVDDFLLMASPKCFVPFISQQLIKYHNYRIIKQFETV